jgi:hypothetical protein
MQSAGLPQEDDRQSEVDHRLLEQEDGVQQVDTNLAQTVNLLTMVPNLALLAAAFFASNPIQIPDVLGGRHS